MVPLSIISIFITYIFFQAGINKIFSFKKTVEGLENKLKITKYIPFLSQLIILCVILLELFAPLYIIYSSFTNKYKNLALMSISALIVFTILATLLYHPKSFASNLSLVGGLILLAKQFTT